MCIVRIPQILDYLFWSLIQHCLDQPTYYHFHVHVVHAALEAGATQAVGKAFGLENIISQLECMADGNGMADLSITYTIGEAHDLWKNVFLPMKSGRKVK
jgi:m7GpppX diphosphatase